MGNDFRYALRTLGRERAFATMVVLSLGVGIGANTAIFSMVNGILLRPLAVREPGQLVSIREVIPQIRAKYPTLPVNFNHFFTWREQSRSFESLTLTDDMSFNLTGQGVPELLSGTRVLSNAFDLLGVRPQLGRAFLPDEDRAGNDRVVLLADSLWRRRFRADAAVVGRKILLDGHPYTVVGVLPAGFRFPKPKTLGAVRAEEEAEIYKPFGYTSRDLGNTMGMFNYEVVGRLRGGVTPAQALSELNVLEAGIAASSKEKVDLQALVEPLQESVVGNARRGLLVIMGAVGAVLLVLCVNLANMALARASARGRDFAVRAALGAGRWRLVRLALSESLVLAMAGGGLGILLAYWGLQALVIAAPVDLPRLAEVQMDGRALGFGLLLSCATGLFFGILPALRGSMADPQNALRSGGRGSTASKAGARVRHALVSTEVALSVVLLVTAGLLIHSFVRLMRVDKGFDVEKVVAVDLQLPATKYGGPGVRNAFMERLLNRARALPGVTNVSVVSALPFQGETWIDIVSTPGDTRPMWDQTTVNVRFVSPEHFETLRIPIAAGRNFEDRDRNRHVAIVSRAVARRLWPEGNPVGRTMIHNNKPVEIVGIVPDTRNTSLDKQPVNMLYIPYWQNSRVELSVLVRSAGHPRALGGALRDAVWAEDAEVPVPEVRAMEQVMAASVGQRRFQMLLVLVFAAAALALASFGIYGVVRIPWSGGGPRWGFGWHWARRRATSGVWLCGRAWLPWWWGWCWAWPVRWRRAGCCAAFSSR